MYFTLELKPFCCFEKNQKHINGNVTYYIIDPAIGVRKLSLSSISKYFTGVALELTPDNGFNKKDAPKKFLLSDLIGKIYGLRLALVQVILLAMALEIFSIVAPLFNQIVIDNVIVTGDRELLVVLVFGFALMMLFQNAISLARSWFLMRWSMDIGFQWSGKVFSHMIRLPASFFEKRHLGDIISRFGSISSIQGTLTSLFVESILDGLMVVLALTMMLVYSWKLSILVFSSVLIYILIRWISYHPFKEASQERLVISAKENTHFLETLRAIVPLKLYGREDERRSRWQNLRMDVQNRDVKTQKMAILFKVANSTIFGIQGLALFYVGAGQVMDNVLTVGMLTAFSSYAATFSGRIFGLVDLFVGMKMLTMHTERLADIVGESTEEIVNFETDLSRIKGEITLKNVWFRYGEGDSWILKGTNLIIPAGQCLALVGPSGCGKTTLCKLILGLLEPSEGEILIDDIPIKRIGLASYRELVGTVMQDDVLLSGSIQENISFFNPKPNQKLIIECSIHANIHSEIISMPMGYQTLIGDMGSSLSGGQKQRLLMARALYKKPLILALDEATSHLDLDNESKVNNILKQMNLTRIIVAHRPQTINMASRVVKLDEGLCIEVTLHDKK